MKRKVIMALMLSLTMTVPAPMNVNANPFTDYLVFSAPIDNTFIGRQESNTIINNIRFDDLTGHWANESVAHAGSFGVIRGGGGNFEPNEVVSNQLALAFVVRMIGMGDQAQNAAIELQDEFALETLAELLNLGYMQVARQQNIISDEEFYQLAPPPQVDDEPEDEEAEDEPEPEDEDDEELENGEENEEDDDDEENQEDEEDEEEPEVEEEPEAIHSLGIEPVTREVMAAWLARALVAANSEDINLENAPQTILTFGDWETISPTYGRYVEAITSLGIMRADGNGNFNPNAYVTRAEMTQMLRNMDNVFYDIAGIERNTGTVAAFRDVQEVATMQGDVWRNYYIRTAEGGVEVLQHQLIQTPSGQTIDTNVVVFRNGEVGGFELLAVGDQIEYFVRTADDVVMYIRVDQVEQSVGRVQGRLHSVDTEEGTITVRDENDRTFIYHMIGGMFGQDDSGEYIFMDRLRLRRPNFPIGNFIDLVLINNLVTELNFVGQPIHTVEMNGIVIYNSPEFGFLTFMDSEGNTLTRQYNSNDIRVQREGHHQTGSNIGYIGQMFPNFQFNPLETTIAELVPGDLIFMRFDPNDPNVIVNVNAVANFTTRHGLVSQVSNANGRTQILLQFDNNQTAWFELPAGTFVSNQGRPVPQNSIQVGDRLRLLVNQAIIAPGHILESVLEASIQADGHNISSILTGSLSGINTIQQQLMLNNARPLTQIGWGSHNQVQQLNTSARDIAFFHEGQRTSLDQANRMLGRSDVEVYVAIDNSPMGERVRQVTFRDGRDELLSADTVIAADGNGNFQIASFNGNISTDSGTIVRRNGRMVTGLDISVGDFVTVSLNGGNTAAVVDITPLPAASGINFARARIQSVNENISFTVEAMSVFTNNTWIFTPIEREFTIGPDTLFLDEFGFVPPEWFIGYTADSVVGNVYTIIYDGSMATHVIDVPHTNRSVRGTIAYDGSTFLRDAQFQNHTTGIWVDTNAVDNTMNIITAPNTIIVRNNNIVQPWDLRAGDRVRVLTTTLPELYGGVEIPGHVILVEG